MPPRPTTFPRPVTAGQSNAPLTLSEIKVTAGGRAAGMNNPPRSAEHVSGATTITDTLAFPHDRPKYYMHFGIYTYDRPSFTQVGSFNLWKGGSNEILMPLSEHLQDNLEENWETKPIPWIIGGAAEVWQGLKNNPEETIRKTIDQAKGILTDPKKASDFAGAAITKTLGEVDKLTGGGTLGAAAGSKFGFAPNQFVTVLYIGPEYKQHMFSWNLSARDREESETLRRIINVFKKSMSPTLRYGGLVWGYPCIYRILFRPNNEQLYKFKPMCLKEFRVNWAPAGRPSFYRGDQRDRGGAPEGVNITATFLEMEYWHQGHMKEQPLHDEQLTVNNDELYGDVYDPSDPSGGNQIETPA